jgi:hypothetical protein
MDALRNNPVASALAVIIALAGAIVTVVNPETLPFKDYVESVGVMIGLLAIGRGVQSGLENRG